jgi:AcrR family transcriptional regulator
LSSAAAPPTSHEAATGYRKGGEARLRILEAALKVFGAGGFKGGTTRQIAEEAGVNLPALKYYFGGKQGLYLACAREIVGRYERRMLALVSEASAALSEALTPDAARARLKAVVRALAEIMVGGAEAQIWTAFVLREMAEQGPAFDVLYGKLWAPGVELTAGLISRALGEAAVSPAARVQALLLISSLTAFSTARPVSLKFLDWPDAAAERFALLIEVVDRQIDAIGRT